MQNKPESSLDYIEFDENEKLLDEKIDKDDTNEKEFTRFQEIAMLIALLRIQFLALCSDGLIFPFFPTVAVRRGISNLAVGVVFAAYDTTRFLTSPLFGSLVSFVCLCYCVYKYTHQLF